MSLHKTPQEWYESECERHIEESLCNCFLHRGPFITDDGEEWDRFVSWMDTNKDLHVKINSITLKDWTNEFIFQRNFNRTNTNV